MNKAESKNQLTLINLRRIYGSLKIIYDGLIYLLLRTSTQTYLSITTLVREYEPNIEILERKRDRASQKEEKWVLNHNIFDLSRHLRRTVRTVKLKFETMFQTFYFI